MGEGPPYHILAEPGSISPYVIAVGDPGRARIFSTLLENPRLVNENRGFLVYTGNYKDLKVTIATHGVGCPSASIVFEELGMLGAKYITRIGSTGGMRRDLRIGDIVVATGAAYTKGGCGLAQYMPEACGPTAPDPELTYTIMRILEEKGLKYTVINSDKRFFGEVMKTTKSTTVPQILIKGEFVGDYKGMLQYFLDKEEAEDESS
jgi:5'-methylthioadenosine phosphorylase